MRIIKQGSENSPKEKGLGGLDCINLVGGAICIHCYKRDGCLGIIKSRNFLDNNEFWFRRKGRISWGSHLLDCLVSGAKFGVN